MRENKILKILENYELYLKQVIETVNSNDNFYDYFLLETGGTNYDEINKIITYIISSFNEKKCTQNVYKQYMWQIDIPLTFLYKPYIVVEYNKKTTINAYADVNKAQYDNKNNSLKNVLIYYNEKQYNYPNINLTNFKRNLWHELLHVYVTYCIKKEEYENKYIKLNYKRGEDVYNSFENESNISNMVKDIMYYSDKNEINAHLNEMIAYIQEHEDINFTNFNRYIQNLPGYDIIQFLKKAQNDMFNFKNNNTTESEHIINMIGLQIARIYKNQPQYKNKNLSNIKCFNYFVKRINNALLYTHKEFYKILHYTLLKLNRKRWNKENKPNRINPPKLKTNITDYLI